MSISAASKVPRCIVSTKVGRQDKAGSSAAVDCSRVQWIGRTERGAPVQLQRRRCVAAATTAVHAVHCTVITINAGAAAAPAAHSFFALYCNQCTQCTVTRTSPPCEMPPATVRCTVWAAPASPVLQCTVSVAPRALLHRAGAMLVRFPNPLLSKSVGEPN